MALIQSLAVLGISQTAEILSPVGYCGSGLHRGEKHTAKPSHGGERKIGRSARKAKSRVIWAAEQKRTLGI